MGNKPNQLSMSMDNNPAEQAWPPLAANQLLGNVFAYTPIEYRRFEEFEKFVIETTSHQELFLMFEYEVTYPKESRFSPFLGSHLGFDSISSFSSPTFRSTEPINQHIIKIISFTAIYKGTRKKLPMHHLNECIDDRVYLNQLMAQYNITKVKLIYQQPIYDEVSKFYEGLKNYLATKNIPVTSVIYIAPQPMCGD
jgi:hypothetical protein